MDTALGTRLGRAVKDITTCFMIIQVDSRQRLANRASQDTLRRFEVVSPNSKTAIQILSVPLQRLEGKRICS